MLTPTPSQGGCFGNYLRLTYLSKRFWTHRWSLYRTTMHAVVTVMATQIAADRATISPPTCPTP